MKTEPQRSVCVVTGTRAEYGLLHGLLHGLQKMQEFRLQLVVTGAHLAGGFGQTCKLIEDDGFPVDRRVEIVLDSNTRTGMAKSMGLGLLGFADTFADLSPDLLLLLGDRYEAMAAACVALMLGIPIAHIHGGELSEGAVDDALRHSITKMSHLHFVAADEYRKRVIQMGEKPDRVFVVGGLGVDAIHRIILMDRSELEQQLGVSFDNTTYLITYHPATMQQGAIEEEFSELLAALAESDANCIFTKSNADAGGMRINVMIDEFVDKHRGRAVAFASLGQQRFLSTMKFAHAVVGNSSSGLLEAPTFKTPTVNIGNRQQGRLRADSVIDCPARRDRIADALAMAASPEFRAGIDTVRNPYGDGGATEQILSILAKTDFSTLLVKEFHDLA